MRNVTVFLVFIFVTVFVIGACGPSTIQTTTPTTTPVTKPTATQPTTYPWKVIYADDDPGSFFLPGNLIVGLDFGKEISEAERDQFRVGTNIADGKDSQYECIAAMTCGSMNITRGDKSYQFGPCIFFAFDVEKGVPSYKINLEDWSPFDLGDPFTEPIYAQ